MPAKKATAKKATAKKATAKKATPRGSSQTMPAEPGDLIVIDSPQVGSLPREGEVLEVIQGEVSLSYRVQWADGHQSLITPASGAAGIIRASKRA